MPRAQRELWSGWTPHIRRLPACLYLTAKGCGTDADASFAPPLTRSPSAIALSTNAFTLDCVPEANPDFCHTLELQLDAKARHLDLQTLLHWAGTREVVAVR
eukprot:1141358-Pelagomonas_calceolata.AAC.10